MALTMYQFSTPVFIRGLGVLATLLAKGQAHADAAGITHDTMLAARLAPDMLPLSRQVQIAADAAKFAIARLSGVDAPKFADTESSFAQLQERLANTVTYLKSVDAAALEGSETRSITLSAGEFNPTFTGEGYLLQFALPNFYFHITTAYDLLRHQGVQIGKLDYLGPM
jgi:hypothetical protein